VTYAALALAVATTHLWAGYVAWAFYDAGSRIFVGDVSPDQTARPTFRPGDSPSPTDDYAVPPAVTPPTREARINILLTGIDAAEDRDHSLTDTLLVASIDPLTNKVALISFPRDISNFELSDGRIYRGKINSLMTYARNHPAEFPAGAEATLVNELGYLLGVPIHYYAAVDLDGFSRMIDLVGGVTVDNPRAINDPRYRWLDGHQGFSLSAGIHNLDGVTALAYVRSRQGQGDNDFTRARRQQQVLLSLRGKLTSPQMLPQLPQILDVAGDTIRTNFPSDRINEMIELATRVNDDDTFRAVLGPPYATNPPLSSTGGIYTLKLDMEKVAALSIELFGADSRYAAAGGLGTQ
jgi:LCP family protein required for cell wall assembly